MSERLTNITMRSVRAEVDLKWSAWAADRGHWEDHAPKTLAHLEELEPGLILFIVTAPRKEIRFGEVSVTIGDDQVWRAVGWFRNDYDDGHSRQVEVCEAGTTLDELLLNVDRREDELLPVSEQMYDENGDPKNAEGW